MPTQRSDELPRNDVATGALVQALTFTVFVGQADSFCSSKPDQRDGVFEAAGNVGLPIVALCSARICEGLPGGEFNGDAYFELLQTIGNLTANSNCGSANGIATSS